MVVAIVFTITLADAASEAKFLTAFAELQQYVWRSEPGTVSYELLQAYEALPAAEAAAKAGKLENAAYEEAGGAVALTERSYLVLERYACERDVHLTHFNSSPFQSFVAKLGDGSIAVSQQSLATYTEGPAMTRLRAALAAPAGGGAPATLATVAAAHVTPAAAQGSLPISQRKGVLVFGGARPGGNPAYVAEATRLGELIRQRRVPLVYGGGTVGVMGAVAAAARDPSKEDPEERGFVVSVIPRALCPREVSGNVDGSADLLYLTETMAERKSIMLASCFYVVALPGGIGTFDELLEVLTLYQLNICNSDNNNAIKIGLVNANNYFGPFLDMLRHLIAEGFCEEVVFDYLVVAETAEELLAKMDAYEMPLPAAHTLVWEKRP